MEQKTEKKVEFDIDINELADIAYSKIHTYYNGYPISDWDLMNDKDIERIDKNHLKNKQEEHYSKGKIEKAEKLRIVMNPLEISLQLYKEIKDKKETKDVFRERGKVYFTPNLKKICVQARYEDDKLMSGIVEELFNYISTKPLDSIIYIAPVITENAKKK